MSNKKFWDLPRALSITGNEVVPLTTLSANTAADLNFISAWFNAKPTAYNFGALDHDPVVSPFDGGPIPLGAQYYNTVDSLLKVYGSGGWFTPNVNMQILQSPIGYMLIGSADGTVFDSLNLKVPFATLSASGGSNIVGYIGVGTPATTVQAHLREIDVVAPYTALNRGYTQASPVGSVTPPIDFQDRLSLSRFFDGALLSYLQDPYEKIDFSKRVAVNNYYVNFTLGTDSGAGNAPGAGGWKRWSYAIANAVPPCVIHLEDKWIGVDSLVSPMATLNGDYKFVSDHPSGHTMLTSMRESYSQATFNFADETNGCWSTSTATTNATVFSYVGNANWDANYLDADGVATPLIQVASAGVCIATPGTQYHDAAASKKYIHMVDGRKPDPANGWIYGITRAGIQFQQSAPSGGTILHEGLHVYMNAGAAPSAGCRYRHSTTATNTSRYGVKNGICVGGGGNNYETYDAQIVVFKNCVSKQARYDDFNYHSFQTTGTKGYYMTVYEYGSVAASPGFDSWPLKPVVSNSSNASTCHDSINIERANCRYGGGTGAVVADVNGCTTVCWNVNSGPSVGGSFKSCFWSENYLKAGPTWGMWLWGCYANDGGDNSVRLCNNEHQAGTAADDGQIYIKYWRGQVNGSVTGTLKDWAGNNL